VILDTRCGPKRNAERRAAPWRLLGPGLLLALLASLIVAGAGRSGTAAPPPAPSPLADTKDEETWTAPADAAAVKNPIPADEKSVAVGKGIYTRYCLACHGTAGKGDGPAALATKVKPGDLSNPKMWQETDGALFWKVTTGRGSMISYKKQLTDDERWQAIDYIRTLAPKPAP
jgi:mono/diheme cytochrome c family protein